MPWFCKKVPWFWNNMSCLCASMDLSSYLKCNFKRSWRKKTKIFPCSTFLLFVTHETFINVPPFQETSLAPKKSSLRAWLRRFNVDEQMLFQRWNLVENESWADVCLSTLFQRWQDNVETTLTELRRFNVDDPILFQS